ncbi:PGPGW domain-containing protein [Chthonobacter albigriseus]|uniref:PGPGW domain-containing protein n=1 Tax=Chthonobacter albigriseus TaxID=1683161 RepID=UPI0015EF00AD|nr:PGPGW domain-containing protein [Chthonobacter albigriseus]
MPKVTFQGRKIPLPRSRILRTAIGAIFILMGFVGFLPVLGFWMVPVGLLILSVDFPWARRIRRRVEVAVTRWWREHKARRDHHARHQKADERRP